MGHNRSILNANDVDIQCIDGAIDIVYYDGVESGNLIFEVVCGYFLAILQPIRTFSPKLLQLLPTPSCLDRSFDWVCSFVLLCGRDIWGSYKQ